MALIDKIKAIADAIRDKTGSTGLMTLDEMAETIEYMDTSTENTNAYILVDENGREIPAVLVDEEVKLTATVNDIRKGTTAVTDDGVVTGEKEIPAYYVTEGARKITPGSQFLLKIRNGRYAYTRLQALFCVYNTSIDDSVFTDRVVINDSVYPVNSNTAISKITLNDDAEMIMFNVTNTGDNAYILRYFSYKEEY